MYILRITRPVACPPPHFACETDVLWRFSHIYFISATTCIFLYNILHFFGHLLTLRKKYKHRSQHSVCRIVDTKMSSILIETDQKMFDPSTFKTDGLIFYFSIDSHKIYLNHVKLYMAYTCTFPEHYTLLKRG